MIGLNSERIELNRNEGEYETGFQILPFMKICFLVLLPALFWNHYGKLLLQALLINFPLWHLAFSGGNASKRSGSTYQNVIVPKTWYEKHFVYLMIRRSNCFSIIRSLLFLYWYVWIYIWIIIPDKELLVLPQ